VLFLFDPFTSPIGGTKECYVPKNGPITSTNVEGNGHASE